ncbi:MAG: hypothetical protein AB1Z98_32115 [Nannocystaceae bacterium]
MREEFSPQGRLTLTLRDPVSGRIVERRFARNLVTLAGRQLLSELFAGTVNAFDAVEVVVGNGGIVWPDPGEAEAPTVDNVVLLHDDGGGAEPAPAPIVAEIGTPEPRDFEGTTRMVTPVLATLEATPGSGPLYLREAGIQFTLPAPGGTVLYNRVAFGLITKDADLQLTLSWEIIF